MMSSRLAGVLLTCALLYSPIKQAFSADATPPDDRTYFEGLGSEWKEEGIPSPTKVLEAIDFSTSGKGLGANACVSVSKASRIKNANPSCPLPKDSCMAFMDEDCVLGEKGAFIKKLFKRQAENAGGKMIDLNHFINSPPKDLRLYCPGYRRMTRGSRETFWVWMMMQLSFNESQCDLKEYQKVAPLGNGAFQMENKDSTRRAMRPAICWQENFRRFYGARAQIYDTKPNTHCALAILATQFAAPGSDDSEQRVDLKGLSSGRLFSDMSYFAQLRKPNGEFANRLRRFEGCRAAGR
ncbi:MAG: hypothetical protein H7301_12645 [Cryobacterium sp.]|nr:hypothetical protein [Oligoflexia bacterium]